MPSFALTGTAVSPWRRLSLVLLFGALAAVAACGPPGGSGDQLPEMPETKVLLAGATLGVDDVIAVRVYQEKELSATYRIAPDGSFDFPMIGRVQASGLTSSELSAAIMQRLKDGYLRDPQVSVFVKEFNSKKVFVLGLVNKPGTFTYTDKMTIVQAVTLAGGLKPLAAKNDLVLTRVVDGEERKFKVPFEAIGLGRQPNVVLQPGDIVFVPESWL